MDFNQLLAKKKTVLVKKWFHTLNETYPSNTFGFLEQGNDRFANPIGHTANKAINSLFDEITGRMDFNRIAESLVNIIRMRAVQDFTPSETISFLFSLKTIVREELSDEIQTKQSFEELLKFESRIDRVILLALDVFTKCREKINELRLHEVRLERERAFRLLEKADLLYSIKEDTVTKEGSREI